MAHCLLALGSNLGDRQQHLRSAVSRLSEHAAIELLVVSRFHETPPAGGPDGQDPFLNGAALLQTSLSAEELLRVTQAVEELSGRTREIRWGPRCVDLDLLIYDDLVCRTPNLSLPHPWMVARRFVIEPAAEIAPEMVHPELGWTLQRLQRHLSDTPNRVAVVGISGSDLSRRICQQVSATLIADPLSQDEIESRDPASIPNGRQQIELAERRCQCLSASNWCQQGACAISEFWFAESVVMAHATLDDAELAEFADRLSQLTAAIPAPKLLILCPTAEVNATTRLPFQWVDLCEHVRGQDEYPWLEIPVASEDRMIDQITAALESMR